MSLYNLRLAARVALTALTVAGLSGCQVRPLYSETTVVAAPGEANAKLGSISIAEPKDRISQEVRNHLIFALRGGAGEPASPAYVLDMGVSKRTLSVANVAFSGNATNQPTSGGIVLTALYKLKDMNGQEVASGKRMVTASFDRPYQQFAVLRAERDAENRAARELAEALRLALAADLAK